MLLARAAIREELTSYLDAVMRHDWERVAESFTPSATLDYGTPGVTAVEANIDLLRAGVDRLTAKSTLLGMHADIDVSGDRARTASHDVHRPYARPGSDHAGPNVGRGLRRRVVPRPRRQVAHHRPRRPPPTAGLARPRLRCLDRPAAAPATFKPGVPIFSKRWTSDREEARRPPAVVSDEQSLEDLAGFLVRGSQGWRIRGCARCTSGPAPEPPRRRSRAR